MPASSRGASRLARQAQAAPAVLSTGGTRQPASGQIGGETRAGAAHGMAGLEHAGRVASCRRAHRLGHRLLDPARRRPVRQPSRELVAAHALAHGRAAVRCRVWRSPPRRSLVRRQARFCASSSILRIRCATSPRKASLWSEVGSTISTAAGLRRNGYNIESWSEGKYDF